MSITVAVYDSPNDPHGYDRQSETVSMEASVRAVGAYLSNVPLDRSSQTRIGRFQVRIDYHPKRACSNQPCRCEGRPRTIGETVDEDMGCSCVPGTTRDSADVCQACGVAIGVQE